MVGAPCGRLAITSLCKASYVVAVSVVGVVGMIGRMAGTGVNLGANACNVCVRVRARMCGLLGGCCELLCGL